MLVIHAILASDNPSRFGKDLVERIENLVRLHCMKIKIFILRKFVKRKEKMIFSLVFVCFGFTEISYFLNFSSNKNVKKQYLSANVYSCVNMKFLYPITVRKDVVLLQK